MRFHAEVSVGFRHSFSPQPSVVELRQLGACRGEQQDEMLLLTIESELTNWTNTAAYMQLCSNRRVIERGAPAERRVNTEPRIIRSPTRNLVPPTCDSAVERGS